MAKRRKKNTVKKTPSKKPKDEKSSKAKKNTKKAVKKTRTAAKGKNTSRKSNGASKLRTKNKVSKSAVSNKANSKRKVRSNAVKSSTSRKRTKSPTVSASGKVKGILRVAKQNRKTWNELDFNVSKIREYEDKKTVFKDQAAPYLKKQLKKKGGKPPRGIVVIVTDKQGNTAGALSPLTFVVNQENTQKFVDDFLDELQENVEYFQETVDKAKNKYADDYALIDTLETLKEENYGNLELHDVQNITIKFIY